MANSAFGLSRRCFLGSLAMLAPVARSDDDATENKQQLRAYESALEIVNDLPERLKPKSKVGWDKYHFDEVEAWLKSEPVGRRFESRFKIESAHVAKVPSYRGGDQQWKLNYDFVDRDFRFRGLELKESIYFTSVKRPVLVGDEAFARRAEKVPTGHNVAVTGVIKAVQFLKYHRSARLGISLDGVVISSNLFDVL